MADDPKQWVEDRQAVRMFYAHDRDLTHGIGYVVAYAERPTVVVDVLGASRTSWLAELCEPAADLPAGPAPHAIPPKVRRVIDGHGCIYDATDDPEVWRHAAHGDGALAGAPISTSDLLMHGVFEVPAAVATSAAAPADDEAAIERVAEALHDFHWRGPNPSPQHKWENLAAYEQIAWCDKARAALAALRWEQQ